MDISEGDVVVTPGGKIAQVKQNYGRFSFLHEYGNAVDTDNLIQTASPLRIRVSHEADAKALISRAEEAGFGFPDQIADIRDKGKYAFIPDGKAIKHSLNISGEKEYLTYPQESRQILGWLDFHASEDECDRCSGEGEIWANSKNPPVDNWKIPCPDCSEDGPQRKREREKEQLINQSYEAQDDEKQWESPDPSDPAWREAFREEVIGQVKIYVPKRMGFREDDSTSEILLDYIDDLETERDELRERIREAKERLNQEATKTSFISRRHGKKTEAKVMHETYQILDGEGESQ